MFVCRDASRRRWFNGGSQADAWIAVSSGQHLASAECARLGNECRHWCALAPPRAAAVLPLLGQRAPSARRGNLSLTDFSAVGKAFIVVSTRSTVEGRRRHVAPGGLTTPSPSGFPCTASALPDGHQSCHGPVKINVIIQQINSSFLFKINSELILILPIVIVVFLEIWPLKSSGSFFTTWNATFLWLNVALLISATTKKLN